MRGRRWPLDDVAQSTITVGGPGADIVLTQKNALPQDVFRIMARRSVGDTEILVTTSHDEPACRINGRSISDEQPLWDRDEIQIGAYRLRYENLRRRRSLGRTVS